MDGKDGAWRISIQIRKPDLRTLAVDWSAPLLLALLTFLGALQLFDAFEVVYYPMIHRAMGIRQFDLGLCLVSPLLFLLLIWSSWIMWKRHFLVLPFPVVAITLYSFTNVEAVVSIGSLLAVASSLWVNRKIVRYLACVLALLGSIEALALLHWAVFLPIGLPSQFLWYANLEMGLFYLLARLAPFLSIPLMFLWIPKLIIHWRRRRKVKNASPCWMVDYQKPSWSKFLLFFSIILSIIAAVYPYLPSVNPHNRHVGVDFNDYVEQARIVEQDLSQVFKIGGGSRPFIFLFIYGFQTMFGLDIVSAVKYLPVILNPLLAVSIYFLVRELFLNNWIASWSSFFTVCGIQVAVGMFALFLTNLMALCIVYFSLGLFIRALRYKCWINLLLAFIIGSLIVFTHPWTFDQYYLPAVLMGIFVFYNDYKKNNNYINTKMIIFYLIILGFSELVKMTFLHGISGLSATSSLIKRISNIYNFWQDTTFSFRNIYSGLLSNNIIIFFSIIGSNLLNINVLLELYFIIFFIVSSLLFLIGDAMIKSRLLYNLPFGIFASYGFIWLKTHLKMNKPKNPVILLDIFNSFIVLNMVTYLFRSLANLI